MKAPKKLTTSVYHDKDGESFTRITLYARPEHWTSDQISEWVENRHPSTYCQHSYDCCGHFYANGAHWAFVGWGDTSFLVHQVYRLNI